MTKTIGLVSTFTHRGMLRAVYNIQSRGASLPFDGTYVPADTYGNKFLYPGMIIGYNDDKTGYVPWDSTGAASYGSYSSYAAGIVDALWDFTYEDQILAPAVHCHAIKQNCYVYGSAVGTIPDDVIQATGNNFEMRLVQWV